MSGASEAARDAVLREFDPVATAAGGDAARLAEQLFSVVDTLDSSGSLRRALTDPARPGTDKGTLVGEVFGALDPRVVDVVTSFVHRRWAHGDDLGDAVEAAGVDAALAAAESAGELAALEDELFRLDRALVSQREVLVALDDRNARPEAKVALARAVFGPRLSPTAATLLEHAVRAPRGRRLSRAIDAYMRAAARRRDRTVASVTSAVELSADQRARLALALREAYGHEVQINVAVVPSVLGGLRIQVGDQVVDGTVLSRLDDARRRLVG